MRQKSAEITNEKVLKFIVENLPFFEPYCFLILEILKKLRAFSDNQLSKPMLKKKTQEGNIFRTSTDTGEQNKSVGPLFLNS